MTTVKRSRPWKRGKLWFGYALLVLFMSGSIGLGILCIAASRVELAGEETTQSGLRRNISHYVRMRDGVRLAVDVWLPPDYHSGERLPVLMRSTRYWRAIQPRFEWRLRILLGLERPDVLFAAQDRYFSKRRFVLVLSDMRGTGASEGKLESQLSPYEIRDLGDLVDWSARQPWSNGNIGSYGTSYEGMLAELTAVSGSPAVRAEAPLYDDFDTMAGWARPGGVYDNGTIAAWSQYVFQLDHDDLCGLAGVTGLRCWLRRTFASGVKHTDEDRDGQQLAEVLRHRANPSILPGMSSTEFRDDTFSTSQGPLRFDQITPFGLRQQIEASRVPLMVWSGWMDAGSADGALNRYRNFSNPQIVTLGAVTHGSMHGADALRGKSDPSSPPLEEQWKAQADFFDEQLRQRSPAKVSPRIDYFTMGEGAWHTTAIWPPKGLVPQRLYFASHKRLDPAQPEVMGAADAYRIDFDATTGVQSRWRTKLGGGYVDYGNRADQDAKLLVYTSDPLSSDTEITGTPVVSVELASSASDGALHAYLEDVAPDGRVTYLTEGIIRLINRRETQAQLPYEPLGPRRTYARRDSAPMMPGKPERVSLEMFATSVLMRKGHSIRVALAGADKDNFEKIAAGLQPQWTVYRDRELSSYIDIPARPR
jgi:putative CocE/NonD family hydrolase